MPYVCAVLNGALTPKAGAAHHDEKPSIIGLMSMESSNEHESRLRILADRHVARRRRRDARHGQRHVRHVHRPRRNDLRRGAALCGNRFRLRCPRGTALSLVYRPGTGNSAGHHHLDGAVDRCASGAVAGYRAVAAAALGARQSRWAAARPRRLPLCRSVAGAGGRRGDDLWLRHIDGGLAPPVGSTRPGRLR
jgi:hypothetical protein